MNKIHSATNITYMQQIDEYNCAKFAKRVKELRIAHSKSLNKFVMHNGGITTATWSRVENGKNNFKLSTIIKIASALGITVTELMDNIDFDYSLEEF